VDELQNLQELLDALLDQVGVALQSGRPLSDELQGLIAEQLEWLYSRIQELKQSEAPAIPPTPKLEPGPFPSSNVNSFKYDPKTQQLFVKFHGDDSADSGPIYQYQNVPLKIYDAFASGSIAPRTSGRNRYHQWIKGVTPSLGASLNALIKEGGYPYARVS